MSDDLGITMLGDKVMVSSRVVAEKFGRRHKDILKRIEDLDCSEEFNERNFTPVTYTDAKGEQRPEVLMTRDGFTFCVMGMTGKRAAQFKEKYIRGFNQMEETIKGGGLTLSYEREASLRTGISNALQVGFGHLSERQEVMMSKVDQIEANTATLKHDLIETIDQKISMLQSKARKPKVERPWVAPEGTKSLNSIVSEYYPGMSRIVVRNWLRHIEHPQKQGSVEHVKYYRTEGLAESRDRLFRESTIVGKTETVTARYHESLGNFWVKHNRV